MSKIVLHLKLQITTLNIPMMKINMSKFKDAGIHYRNRKAMGIQSTLDISKSNKLLISQLKFAAPKKIYFEVSVVCDKRS